MAITTLSQYYQSIGKPLPSLSERAKAYEQAGLGSAATYTGTAAQNTSLLGKLTTAPAPTTSTAKQATMINPTTGEKRVVVAGSSEASNLFGQGFFLMGADGKAVGYNPAVSTSQPARAEEAPTPQIPGGESSGFTFQDGNFNIPGFGELTAGSFPEAPDLVKQFRDLRAAENVDALEGDVTRTADEIRKLTAAHRAGQQKIEGSLAPMQVIRGEQRELENQFQQQREVMSVELQAKADILRIKQDTIGTIMNLTSQNFQNAKEAYTTKFNMAMEAQRMFMQKQEFELSRSSLLNQIENQKRDDARANLSVLNNMMAESGKTWANADPGMLAQLRSLELRAGLPAGSMEAFSRSKPKANLLAQIDGFDSAGNGVVTFIYADENGNPGMVRTVKTGTRRPPTGDGSGTTIKSTSIPSGFAGKRSQGEGKGFDFFDSRTNDIITAGQYAAAKGQNVVSLLNGGSAGDKNLAAKIGMANEIWWSEGYDPTQALANAQKTWGWIFNGVDAGEFSSITGYRKPTQIEINAAKKQVALNMDG
jgi:hypothetical protein